MSGTLMGMQGLGSGNGGIGGAGDGQLPPGLIAALLAHQAGQQGAMQGMGAGAPQLGVGQGAPGGGLNPMSSMIGQAGGSANQMHAPMTPTPPPPQQGPPGPAQQNPMQLAQLMAMLKQNQQGVAPQQGGAGAGGAGTGGAQAAMASNPGMLQQLLARLGMAGGASAGVNGGYGPG